MFTFKQKMISECSEHCEPNLIINPYIYARNNETNSKKHFFDRF